MRVKRNRGTAAVEFALALPFMLLVLAGIVDFGRAYSMRVTLTNAAREGARYAAGNPDDVTGAATRVMDELSGSNVSLASMSDISLSAPDGTAAGDPVYVTVQHTMQPFLGAILGIGDQTLRARASMAILPD
ncbi:MAG: hypothetical protein AUJ92_03430 [Armatimonadetes bacterium CG2_30_59_28]|nr:pilus assembly protein [Armatimonadota bacterium]OIO97559.1 MAG: hypothetical protein AUJ92_03430 [Armatimonadetes bacterium CG2_30_59_28]PIU62384.1 MAG: pilus assembly protein TadE [Armatimonadetes bacterium CG07_land_8_20_14_0_80_59_28]PIX41439.1 MAG: pilus assembly protein TadE [Armatimonadetes bacterium CG_4_8_14_3_um_filter_58_9]PIY37075.1 MAG: pilus assembly protein TadE [Armatimonadetes bacterium CG_4_10_14_3_um_filter_59_10]